MCFTCSQQVQMYFLLILSRLSWTSKSHSGERTIAHSEHRYFDSSFDMPLKVASILELGWVRDISESCIRKFLQIRLLL